VADEFGHNHGVGTALTEVTEKMTVIIRDEIELAKAEVSEKVSSLLKGAVVGIAAGIFGVFGLIYLLHGFAWLAYWVLPVKAGEVFWGFFLIAIVLFGLGGLAGYLAAKAFKRGTPPTPEMAIDEARRVRETISSSGSAY
jgi:Putative Actinobacterial Holin-X, holin superfamily III